MTVFALIALWLVPLALGIFLGHKRGKLAAGILLPLFFGWIGLIIVACLSNRSHSVSVSTVVNNAVPPQSAEEEAK